MYAETEKYLVGREVYFDTSYVLDKMPREQFARMVNNHGAERVLFASDSPWACQKKFVNELRKMPIGIKEQEMILSHNARKLLGMS
jgi:predicted TIM-barrel fold metal-dependent hydrolase